ncbi:MAG: tetratricopeptide repeat protein [Myxococcota bacterium]
MALEQYAFGPFLLEVEAFRLSRDGASVELQPKQLELLIRLVRSAGELVEREVVQAELWPDVVVTEHSLRTLVYRLRQALGEHEDLIETVPRRGFRFVGAVSRQDGPGGSRSDAYPQPLPAERDPFVGRQAELSALSARFALDTRLVTVVGPPGVGKTRLALQYARSVEGAVFFADLSAARTLDDIARVVAGGLDIPLGQHPIPQLGHALAARGRCLVLLDNFEQVAAHAGATVGAWLDRAAEVRFLVTSREVLGLAGEGVHALAPLGADDARALFEARAAAAGGDGAGSAEVVDALTELLDRLPLAIELAAARAGVLAPEAILARMNDRFRMLGFPSARSGRHATLRATLDWSWELLTADEQRALAQLTVFDGGFSVRAAEVVLALDGTWPVDALQALVHKSLVLRRSADRFALLMSVQDYARVALSEAETLEAERRHGRHYAALGAEALRELHLRGGQGVDALASDLGNLVAACRRAVARADGPVAAATARAASQVTLKRGPLSSGVEWLLAALTLPLDPADELPTRSDAGWALQRLGRPSEGEHQLRRALALARDPGEEASVRTLLGTTLRQAGRMEAARDEFERALELARSAGDRRREAAALGPLGVLHHHQGRVEASRWALETARALSREVGDRQQEGQAIFALGVGHREQGRMTEARICAEEVLAINREFGDRVAAVGSLASLVSILTDQGHAEEALAGYREVLRIHAEHGDLRNEAIELGNLGSLHLSLGQLDEAYTCYQQALVRHRAVGNRRHEGVVLGNLGELHAKRGHAEAAREAAEGAVEIHRALGHRDWEGLSLSLVGTLQRDRDPVGARAHLDRAEALVRATGHAVLIGVVVARRAALEHGVGNAEAARRALDEAEALAVRVGATPRSLLARELALVRAMLDDRSG